MEERAESYGFHIWLRSLSHQRFSIVQTELMHVGFVLAMIVACLIVTRLAAAQWIVITLSILVLLNAISHFVGALSSPAAASGLITSALLWVPLGVLGIARGWSSMSRSRFWLGAAMGAAVQVPVTWLAALFAGD